VSGMTEDNRSEKMDDLMTHFINLIYKIESMRLVDHAGRLIPAPNLEALIKEMEKVKNYLIRPVDHIEKLVKSFEDKG